MSNTPDTDKQELVHSVTGASLHCVSADFARKLERERDEALRLVAVAQEAFNVIHVEVGGWISATIEGGDR